MGIDQSGQSEQPTGWQEEDGRINLSVFNIVPFISESSTLKSSISSFNSSFNFIFPVAKQTRDISSVPIATAVARQHKTLKHPFQNSDRWNEREREMWMEEEGRWSKNIEGGDANIRENRRSCERHQSNESLENKRLKEMEGWFYNVRSGTGCAVSFDSSGLSSWNQNEDKEGGGVCMIIDGLEGGQDRKWRHCSSGCVFQTHWLTAEISGLLVAFSPQLTWDML